MELYQEAVELAERGRLREALREATSAYDRAAESFHHPTMMALLYFPDEHRLAVYFPLLVPIMVPFLATAAKEFKIWKASDRP